MRNWNLGKGIETPEGLSRFYFTYEELKQQIQEEK